MKRSVGIFCSSSNQVDGSYREEVQKLGELIGKSGWTLVFGGNNHGLMGVIAESVKSNGGNVIGVMPEWMKQWNVVFKEADEIHYVSDMYARKKLIEERSDCFVALPGSIGTLDEVSEQLALRQLGIHDKPVVFLNTNGYYDTLFKMFETMVDEKFIRDSFREKYSVAGSAEEVVSLLKVYF